MLLKGNRPSSAEKKKAEQHKMLLHQNTQNFVSLKQNAEATISIDIVWGFPNPLVH